MTEKQIIHLDIIFDIVLTSDHDSKAELLKTINSLILDRG